MWTDESENILPKVAQRSYRYANPLLKDRQGHVIFFTL